MWAGQWWSRSGHTGLPPIIVTSATAQPLPTDGEQIDPLTRPTRDR
jgi:hypothetical protein